MIFAKIQSFLGKLWETFHDVIVALIVATLLRAIYSLVIFLLGLNCQLLEEIIDIEQDLYERMIFFIEETVKWAMFLSLLTAPLAAYFAATNDRLALPIRLLSTAGNVNRFIYALLFTSNYLCTLQTKLIKIKCSDKITYWLGRLLDDFYILNISQYCQVIISLSRFMALAFDGIYFRYTLKLPLLQLIVPYALSVGLSFLTYHNDHMDVKDSGQWVGGGNIDFDGASYDQILSMFFFLMCGLDFVTNRNLKKRRRDGKASQTESLLMWEMIASSFAYLMSTIFFDFIRFSLALFFGWGVMIVFVRLKLAQEKIVFSLLLSTMSIFFFRKRKEKEFKAESSTIDSRKPKKNPISTTSITSSSSF